MAVFTDTNRDKYGVVRGRCKDCPEDCPQYSQPVLRHNCTYCGCPAGQHERVEPRPDLIIKTEPGVGEAESPGQSNGGPPTGPSRRPDGWTTVQVRPGPSRRNESPNVSTTHRDQSQTVIQTQVQPGPSRRNESPDVSTTRKDQSRTVTQKRCKTLFENDGIEYSQLKRHLSRTERGVFTILWKGEIIYVGEPKKTPISTCLRSIFNGGSNQDISKCLKNVPNVFKSAHIKIAWLRHIDDDPHSKTCKEGKKGMSYRQCLSNLQGMKPRDVLKRLMREEVINF